MRRKLAALLLAGALGAALAGCKKDAQVEAALADLDSFTQELVKRVEAAPNTSDGVDDAQRYFDSRRAEMEGKLRKLTGLRQFEVGEETQGKMRERVIENVMAVSKLQLRYIDHSMRDPDFQSRLAKLIQDYRTLLGIVTEG